MGLGRTLVKFESLPGPLLITVTAMRNTTYTLAYPNPLPAGITCGNLNLGATPTVTSTGSASATSSVTVTITSASDVTEDETAIIALGTIGNGTGLGGGAAAHALSISVNFAPKDAAVTHNPRFTELHGHYGFKPVAQWRRRPNKKDRVERVIGG